MERSLFGGDLAIDIVAGFEGVFDGTTTEFLNAVIGGAGGPVAIATVVASFWRCHIVIDQLIFSFGRNSASICGRFFTRVARC